MTSVDQVFSLLDRWRHLPAYQLERRADVFFAAYIPEIFDLEFGKSIHALIPEFPVRIGTIDPKHDINRSFKIDYLATIRDSQEVYFIELKTDPRSRRTKQDWYLERAVEVGIPRLLHGLELIYSASNQKAKYDALISELALAGLVQLSETGPFEVLENDYHVTTLYIQPGRAGSAEEVLTFDSIAEHLAKRPDSLSRRFATSLREWASRTAGSGLGAA